MMNQNIMDDVLDIAVLLLAGVGVGFVISALVALAFIAVRALAPKPNVFRRVR